MNYRLLLLLTLVSSGIKAQKESPSSIVIESESSVAQTEQPAGEQPSIPFSITDSFYHFVRVFVALLNNDKIHNNIKKVEAMLANLMQTAYQVIQNTKAAIITRDARDNLVLDQAIIEEMKQIILKESKQLIIKRAPAHHHGPDEQTQRILVNFAGVVQNFFNILQDPENKEVVAPSILGMITGMINIGAEAMKKDGPPLHANRDAFEAYVHRFDDELKEGMLHIIVRAQERCGFLKEVK